MEMTQCDKCGDTSNSEPGLECGRTDGVTQVPCTGTYQKTQTFVITASIYVDSVATSELAAKQVELLNNGPGMDGYGVDIRLPDPDSGYKWEPIG